MRCPLINGAPTEQQGVLMSNDIAEEPVSRSSSSPNHSPSL
jgi:hypothetical protein